MWKRRGPIMARFEEGEAKTMNQMKEKEDPNKDFHILQNHSVAEKKAKGTLRWFKKIQDPHKLKEFKVFRWNPDKPHKPFLQSYHVDLSSCGTMVLDVLQKIKAEQDPTLTFRRSCREGICGSCSMNIDGDNTVACLKPVDLNTASSTTITPLPHMFATKDLLVDLTAFYQQDKAGLKTRKKPEDGREYRQSPQDREKLDGLYECILCACCSSACPADRWNGEEFLGPTGLLHAYRWIQDSRDEFGKERLQALTEDEKRLYRCRTIRNCTATCPKSLDPARAINSMRLRHQLG